MKICYCGLEIGHESADEWVHLGYGDMTFGHVPYPANLTEGMEPLFASKVHEFHRKQIAELQDKVRELICG